jgi:hypothetical protein
MGIAGHGAASCFGVDVRKNTEAVYVASGWEIFRRPAMCASEGRKPDGVHAALPAFTLRGVRLRFAELQGDPFENAAAVEPSAKGGDDAG